MCQKYLKPTNERKKLEEHWFYKFMGTQIHECGTNQKLAHNNATQGCKWNVHQKFKINNPNNVYGAFK